MNFSRVARTKRGLFVNKREHERRNEARERLLKAKCEEPSLASASDARNSSTTEKAPDLSGR